MAQELNVSDRWRLWRQRVDLDEYDGRWDKLAAEGASVHGEADLVCALGGGRVLDAGCGTGRVAIELARRGHQAVGVDNDADMLARARSKAVDVTWILADLATVSLAADPLATAPNNGRSGLRRIGVLGGGVPGSGAPTSSSSGDPFDVVVMAGDVLNYVRRGDESLVVANLSRHLAAGGRLVCGASLAEPTQLTHYDNWCRSAGLELEHRFASWTGVPYDRPGHYAVSIHRRPIPVAAKKRRRVR